MARLTVQQLHNRLKIDYQIVMQMRSPLMNVTAYDSADDLDARRNPIISEEDGPATFYLVDYYIKTLVGRDRYSDKTSIKIDLLSNGNYPYTQPLCYVVSSETPWSPHFRDGLPICIDHEIWYEAKGGMLLGHLLVHIAKLLNFDEMPYSDIDDYVGYNPEAAYYWRTVLNRQPITPDTPYPVLPPAFTDLWGSSFFNRILGVRKKDKAKRPLRVFLCHANGDKQAVRNLYNQLCGNGIDAWLDEEKLLAGQKWKLEIPKVVKNSDIVIVCLSKAAINKSGYVQKEIKYALDVADEKPEDSIYIIPLKLEQCDIPDRLCHLHCVGLHEERGYERLMLALKECAAKLE